MPSTFLGLNTGLSGLTYFQTALNTTAHNISNADTKGYSRQNVQASASDALRLNKTYGMMGTGITASEKCILRLEILVCKFQVQSVQFTACQSRTVTDVYERNDFRGRLYKMDGRDVRCHAGSLDKASRLYNANLLCAYGRFFHRHGE